ncbi:hypothetical protein HB884_14770 [Listeria booriae]|uniref:Uncharacterized protein n=1 Tax=Listeria booriae TaxID=1552123 RepID=A0A7X0XCK0_9LIST|nr:hypothetical protein [Listeria booriae]MBC1491443.1 hypothetical protein [Listeria booriae]MBC1525470.1 hypothetical protein [Listeria booriae]
MTKYQHGIVYSKRNGVNQFLFSFRTTSELFLHIDKEFERRNLQKHMHYAYALVDGKEIKLFD